jgi:dephospho-CoA kinase
MARRERSAPRRPPLRIALTGGIASGKSTVAGLFAVLGVPVIDTDQIAREVVEPGTPGLAAVTARFGAGVLDAAGRLDRAGLRRIVFADPAARRDLEGLLHPLIRARTGEHSRAMGGEYQLIVVPLLIETGTADAYDRVLVVDCEPQTQLERLVLRDRIPVAQAQAILAAQASRDARLQRADDVVVNSADLPALGRQVEALHGRYTQLAAGRP